MFKVFFEVINQNIDDQDFLRESYEDIDEILEYYCRDDSKKIDKVKKLIKKNRKVYFGHFHDECCTAEEYFLCGASYLISNDDLYFDFEQDGY